MKRTKKEIEEIIAEGVDIFIKTLEEGGVHFVDEDNAKNTEEEIKENLRRGLIKILIKHHSKEIM